MSSPQASEREPQGERPSAVVLAVQLPDVGADEFESSLTELQRLADTLGLRVVGRVTQKRPALASASVVGAGKLKVLASFTGGEGVLLPYAAPGRKGGTQHAAESELDAEAPLAEYAHGVNEADGGGDPEEELAADAPQGERGDAEPGAVRASVVLVDHDLTPGQMRNLEKATGAEVMDRSMVILSIFQRHARTREARLQVEIARLAYTAPRLREAHAGQDRQRGGIGGKGAGESALELDRRRIRDRIAELRRELEIVQREADTRRNRRAGPDTSTVALVGYTNAGKSSLMRALTGDAVYVADRLFATLDTTVRVLVPETRPRILVSDTVGFIKKLPHDLVASFRSTLEEAKDASLLLHLVDAADPALRDQIEVTRQVLTQVGAHERPTLLILNKADRLTPELAAELAREFPDAFLVSALSAEDVQRLHARIADFFERDMQEEEFLVPYAQQREVARMHEVARVLEEGYEEAGTRIRVRASTAVLGGIRRALGGEDA